MSKNEIKHIITLGPRASKKFKKIVMSQKNKLNKRLTKAGYPSLGNLLDPEQPESLAGWHKDWEESHGHQMSEPESGQLACEKHNRILIGKDRCVDCEPVKQGVDTTHDSTGSKDDSKRSFFDMPEEEKREIVEEADKESNRMQQKLMGQSEEECDHEIAWNGDFHIEGNHPTLTDQNCLNCGKTLDEIINQARQKERERILREVIGGYEHDDWCQMMEKIRHSGDRCNCRYRDYNVIIQRQHEKLEQI